MSSSFQMFCLYKSLETARNLFAAEAWCRHGWTLQQHPHEDDEMYVQNVVRIAYFKHLHEDPAAKLAQNWKRRFPVYAVSHIVRLVYNSCSIVCSRWLVDNSYIAWSCIAIMLLTRAGLLRKVTTVTSFISHDSDSYNSCCHIRLAGMLRYPT